MIKFSVAAELPAKVKPGYGLIAQGQHFWIGRVANELGFRLFESESDAAEWATTPLGEDARARFIIEAVVMGAFEFKAEIITDNSVVWDRSYEKPPEVANYPRLQSEQSTKRAVRDNPQA